MQTFYFSFCIFSTLADSRNQLCFVGSQWIHLYLTGIYGYGYIHGYSHKICGYGYGYGWEISYPRQPWILTLEARNSLVLPTTPSFEAPAQGNPLETYPRKTRGMGLLHGKNCVILASTVFD